MVGPEGILRLASDARYLAGSALTMPQAASNLVQQLHLSAPQVTRLCELYPRAALHR